LIIPHQNDLPLFPLITHIAVEAARLRLPVYLVGGYVRDVLLGRVSFDLDFVTEGDAHLLASAFEGNGRVHLDRFGTAHWTIASDLLRELGILEQVGEGFTVDFATARTETYTQPATLPTIDATPANLPQDLLRRDFSINALALRLPDLQLILRLGMIRALHDRSFIDDPTRIFRAARYAARFNFQVDPQTEVLIHSALSYIDRLSGERIAEEFRRIFDETDPYPVLEMLQGWGGLRQIDPSLRVDQNTQAAFQRLREMGYANEVASWCVLLYPTAAERILQRLELSRLHIDSVVKTQKMVKVMRDLPTDAKPSAIVEAIEAVENREQVNRIACTAAWAIQLDPRLLGYLEQWRNVRPTLNGEDLKAMGLRPGRQFGTMLDRLRAAWLDGEIHTAEEERALLYELIPKR
jgi:tRNA nucleotidyltransferase (CCA-adding enzyme)